MVTVNVLGLGVPVRCAASGGDASRSNYDDVLEMMDERAPPPPNRPSLRQRNGLLADKMGCHPCLR